MRLPRLRREALRRVHELAEQMLERATRCIGEPRMLLEEELDLQVPARERLLWQGLKKLIEDRCTFAVSTDVDPVELRHRLFAKASQLRLRTNFDRDTRMELIEQVAKELSCPPQRVEDALFADLKPAQRLEEIDISSADELVCRYELGRAQCVLLKAQHVEIRFRPDSPEQSRVVFQKLKFLQLLFNVEHMADEVILQLEGPLSLFRANTRYGLKLAMALPVVAALPECRIRADVTWGKSRTQRVFHWESDELSSVPASSPIRARPEIQRLQTDFQKFSENWSVAPANTILHAPGLGVCVPDLTFTQVHTGNAIHLELLGFWSREAVWRRVDWSASGKLPPVLYVYSDKLRVSESALPQTAHGALLTFKGVIPANKVCAKLEALHSAPQASD